MCLVVRVFVSLVGAGMVPSVVPPVSLAPVGCESVVYTVSASQAKHTYSTTTSGLAANGNPDPVAGRRGVLRRHDEGGERGDEESGEAHCKRV